MAFSLGKRPMEVGASHYIHRENGLEPRAVIEPEMLDLRPRRVMPVA